MTAPLLAYTFSLKLPAYPSRVFAALTEPEQLQRWFAEHAEVELVPGGSYRFHGPAALGTAAPAEATQQLISVEPGRSLRYRWTIHGVATEVGYRVEPLADEPGACELHVAHDLHGELPFASPRYAIDDLWRLITGNLRAHVSDDANVVLPDFTRSTAEVVVSIEIEAPPAKVYRVLTVPELMTRWLGTVARADLTTGEYSFGFVYQVEGKTVHGGPTRILEAIPDQKLVTDWPDWRGDLDKPKTHVTWALAPLPPDGKRTRLTLTHAGFAHPVDRSDYQQGWSFFLDMVRGVAETPEPEADTAKPSND
jgi:uncharacterized protein YndB with AHSA1/START domain